MKRTTQVCKREGILESLLRSSWNISHGYCSSGRKLLGKKIKTPIYAAIMISWMLVMDPRSYHRYLHRAGKHSFVSLQGDLASDNTRAPDTKFRLHVFFVAVVFTTLVHTDHHAEHAQKIITEFFFALFRFQQRNDGYVWRESSVQVRWGIKRTAMQPLMCRFNSLQRLRQRASS